MLFMAKNKPIKNKRLNLSQQAMNLKQCTNYSRCDVKDQTLIWEGVLKPTELSNEYNIRIIYKLKQRPKVILYGARAKDIEKDQKVPHTFKRDKNKYEIPLCLHLPDEFDGSKTITDTIIPWTIEWLFYYEMWLATGEWLGGGHNSKKSKNK